MSPHVQQTLALLQQPMSVAEVATIRGETIQAAGSRLSWMLACGLVQVQYEKRTKGRGRTQAIYVRAESGS